MVLNKETGETSDHIFKDILQFLKPGDCLVLNDTKVLPARLFGIKEDTGANPFYGQTNSEDTSRNQESTVLGQD